MKKEDVSGLFVYLLIFAFAIVFGFTVLREHAARAGMGGMYVLFILGAIAVGILLNSIIFELGHMLGAKAGGYSILSVNILGFFFYKEDNKWKFRFSAFDGLTGETKIVPKSEKESNPYPYLLFGTLFFIVELLAEIILFCILNNKGLVPMNIAYFFLVVGVIGCMILVYNIMPLKLDSITDGYRLRLLSNAKNKEAFNELLRVEQAIKNGETNVEIKTFTEVTNFTAELNLNKVYTLLDNGKFEEAIPLIDTIINSKNGVGQKTYIRARAQKIYIKLMTLGVEERIEFYKNEVPVPERKLISEDVSMASIRAYILMEGLLDKSKSETIIALNNVIKAFKHTSKARQKVELKLYNDALNKVIQEHPDWELEGYILEEDK